MKSNIRFFYVGGCVRDSLLGQKAKDIDIVCLAPSYRDMRDYLLNCGCQIFVEKPEFFTIRAKHPTLGYADFSLCRKDGFYSDGRRPDNVEIGTLFDDLSRRDATINAIA